MAAFEELLQPRARGANSQSLTAVPDLDAMMKEAFDGPRRTATTLKEAQPRRDPATAFDLIDRAAEAFGLLLSRCEQLEAKMHSDAERAQTAAAAQDEVVDQWKRFGTGMKSQAEEMDKKLQAMKTRAEAAEVRATGAEARAVALQQASEAAARQAAAAENLSTEFHDKVVATFGIGSRAHAALEVVAKAT